MESLHDRSHPRKVSLILEREREGKLVLYPGVAESANAVRVAGFGFRDGAGVDGRCAAFSLAGGRADAVATVENKLHGLTEFSGLAGLPLLAVSKQALAAHSRPGSGRVRALYGTGSVAESAALAAAGPGAVLVIGRTRSPDGQAVVAIAEGQGA